MLTESTKRLRYYENIYNNVLQLSNEELIYILKNNSECYTSSPIELEKTIDYLKSKDLSIDKIKSIILKSPKSINLKSAEFIKLLESEN